MIKQRFIIIFIVLIISIFCTCINSNTVYADELSDNIEEQLNNLDLEELEEFYNNVISNFFDVDFNSFLRKNLNGEYVFNAENIYSYIKNICLSFAKDLLPTFISIVVIGALCGFLQKNKGGIINEGVYEITYFASILSIILLLLTRIYPLIENSKNAIENIAKITEIMSPIILTLMMAVGGNVSASVYKPTVTFFSQTFIGIVLYFILPFIVIYTVFNIGSSFSVGIKLNKFADFFAGLIKWVLGVFTTIFSLFLTVQGLTSAHYDGISLKAAKYAISNSVPIVGGFLKDGFDIVVAGSVLIKNSIGVCGIVVLLSIIFSPVIYLTVLSLLLKFCAAILEPICDVRISNLCVSISKTCSYLIACILVVALMFFILILMLILSANAFI